MGLAFDVGKPEQRAFTRLELGKNLRDRRIIFKMRRRRGWLGHRVAAVLEFPPSPSIDNQVAGYAEQVTSPMFFARVVKIDAQHPQKRFLDNVIDIRGVANGPEYISAKIGQQSHIRVPELAFGHATRPGFPCSADAP